MVASRRRRGRSADTCRHLLNMLVQLNVVLALGIINTISVLKRTLHDQTNQLANSATYSTLVLVSQCVLKAPVHKSPAPDASVVLFDFVFYCNLIACIKLSGYSAARVK